MKKLKLNLGFVSEQLDKEQMKKINGGFGSYCDDYCQPGTGESQCGPSEAGNACKHCYIIDESEGTCVS